MEEALKVLKDTAAVLEGLCKKLIEEPEPDEAGFIADTLVQYCRSFDRGYITLLARTSRTQAAIASRSDFLRGRESDGAGRDAFSTSL